MQDEDRQSITSRFERKYRCTYAHYLALKNALSPFFQQDAFTRKAPKHRYLVRSLYFDTNEYKIFFEKSGGNSDRLKYRIRTYSENIQDEPDIRVEMKLRDGNLTRKYGTYITLQDWVHFMSHRHWIRSDDPVLHEFERHMHLLNLIPKTLVQYQREGYLARDGSGLRLTFDHRIRSARAKDLFPKRLMWHIHHEQQVVFEVKHSSSIPAWLQQIVRNHGLRLVSNSKFAFGIQASQPDIIFADWSDR